MGFLGTGGRILKADRPLQIGRNAGRRSDQSAMVSIEAKLSAGPAASKGVVTSTKVSG